MDLPKSKTVLPLTPAQEKYLLTVIQTCHAAIEIENVPRLAPMSLVGNEALQKANVVICEGATQETFVGKVRDEAKKISANVVISAIEVGVVDKITQEKLYALTIVLERVNQDYVISTSPISQVQGKRVIGQSRFTIVKRSEASGPFSNLLPSPEPSSQEKEFTYNAPYTETIQ